MFIEFSVTNFRSIRETQTLSLTASAAIKELQEQNSFSTDLAALPRLLRSAVIYGPNAAGKSSFILAMAFMKDRVINSAKESQYGEKIDTKPFLFDQASQSQPSEFEVLFVADGVRYQYGFAVTKERVTREWLLAYPEGRAQRWFERQYDTSTRQENWYFGTHLKGRRQIWQEATRDNALFLSTAIQLNSEQLQPVFNWFASMLQIVGPEGLEPGLTMSIFTTESSKQKMMGFLAAADLSIADIKLERRKFSADELPEDTPDRFKKSLDGKDIMKIMKIKFLHTVNNTEDTIELDMNEESQGTAKLFAFAGPWLDVLEKGTVLLVDELDNSLHPIIVRFLVSFFHNSETNQHNAQLIMATHDISLLDKDLFRRDQIWFVEKDRSHATRLYPLSDFSPRKGEALEKNYLHGRYGALPFIGELKF